MRTYCDNVYFEDQDIVSGNFLNVMVELDQDHTVSVISTSEDTQINCSNTFIFSLIKIQ